jgi:adenylate cyclase
MAELIAQGSKTENRWRRPLPADQPAVLGREAGAWAVPWEPYLSRRHAQVVWRQGQLEVSQLPEAHNPMFVQGAAAATFRIKPGEHFVIGDTTFTVSGDAVSPAPADAAAPFQEQAFSAEELNRVRFHDAPHRLDVLNRLPDVIAGADDDAELFIRLVNMLLAGIPRAEATALVAVDPDPRDGVVRILHWDRRLATGPTFQVSRRLVQEALGRQQKTVLHYWGLAEPTGADFTVGAERFDWAFCTPVRGEACAGWGIYVAGHFAADGATASVSEWQGTELRDDLKFTELVAAILGALRQVKALQGKQASLSHFFSPAVLRTLTEGDPELVLQPCETEVAILFCDLRGFSRESERNAGSLMALLERVSKALGIMTQNILDHGGVIGDFHGDAAMGFWGWPIPTPDMVERACLAALGIRTFFEGIARQRDHPLAGFQVGVGIASGRAVAGKIGTVDQVKVTVFGPVVNLASRLEGMTKVLRAQILLDEPTARVVRERFDPAVARWRRVARVKPYGLDNPLMVTELLPPAAQYPELTDAHLVDHEAAVDALLQGDWAQAYDLLRRMPPQDRVPDFLTVHIAKYDRRPPAGWSGVIELESKS